MEAHAIFEVEDEDQVIAAAARGILAGNGDPYTAFYTPDEFDQFTDAEKGHYVGIGILVQEDQEDGLLMAMQVYTDSPADRAGILPGDKIIAVDGVDVTSKDTMAIVDLVRGEEGSEVSIQILRAGELIDFTMTREAVTTERIKSFMVDDKIGYIYIYEFAGDAKEKFVVALDELLAQGMESMILDLRNNPGGNRDIVVDIADILFPEGPVLILTNKQEEEDIDYSDKKMLGIPIVCLVNGYSASASELLSAGIQDYGVGEIMGTTTYGKGVAQEYFPLSDGSVFKMTTSDYLTPNRRSVQDVGVVPDIIVEASEELIQNPILTTTEKDNQYMAAIEYLRDLEK